jgi:hypothetical protein
VGTRRERFLAGDIGAGDAGEVVAEDRLALEQVEPIAREATAMGGQDALGAAEGTVLTIPLPPRPRHVGAGKELVPPEPHADEGWHGVRSC